MNGSDERTLSRMAIEWKIDIEQRDEWLEIAREKIQARKEIIEDLADKIEDLNDEIIHLKEQREYWKDFTFKLLKVFTK